MNYLYFGYRRYGDDVYDALSNTPRNALRTLEMKVGATSAAQDDIFSPLAFNPFQFNTSYCRTQLVAGESSESAIDSQKDYLYVTEEQEQEAMKRMKDSMVAKDAAMDVSNGASTGKSKRPSHPSGAGSMSSFAFVLIYLPPYHSRSFYQASVLKHLSSRLGRRVSDKGRIQKKSKPKPADKKGLVPGESTTRYAVKPAEERGGSGDTTTSEHLSSDEDTEDEFPGGIHVKPIYS
ncbi:hypothetical protein OCU04_007054 [Sclerotinia nivalis]|uniref:Uncharacterized protein n=1 Tax=Sclerotinia nivalis TaxID=352851 RepID=A0A9X0AL08_9HELO|nr:hypothetical protein OCU04_007054 [Sclerotinia nivalis]